MNIKFDNFYYDVSEAVHLEITADNKLLIIEADN